MKTKMKIFNVIFALTMLVMPAHVRADDLSACDGYEYFSPAFALCTVHAYNIGDRTNPTSAARTAEMNDVIALKSTVIAQQLKEQYDLLNTMIKRFKTQLEKAVLTSKLEVITGNSSSSSNSSSGSSVNNNGLSNAENCDSYTGEALYDCVVRNLSKISAAIDSDPTNARKQLEHDIGMANDYNMCGENNGIAVPCENVIADCKGVKNQVNKDKLRNCATSLTRKVNSAKNAYILKYRSNNRYP